MAFLEIDNLCKEFPRAGRPPLKVIEDLNVNVEEGALLSILGPSGCGKSTMLNIINGLDDPTSGRIMLNGRQVSTKSKSDVNVSVVFQQPRLLNWRNVADNVRIPLLERGVSKAEAGYRVEKYLDLVGLGDFANTYPLQLSGGMQQRASLARGLAIEPDLLLADEPFSALDEFTARKLREEFVRVWQATGRTILFVTHNIREAVFLSSRMLVISARPSTTYLELDIKVPQPRSPEDDVLFDLEKSITADFMRMEEESEAERLRQEVAV